MRPQSCKAKGRRLQQFVANEVQRAFALETDDVRSTSMGANGEDVLLSAAARARFPFAVECKNTERINLWEAWSQTKSNAGAHSPLLVVHKNNSDTLCVLHWKVFMEMARRSPASSQEPSATDEGSAALPELVRDDEEAAPPPLPRATSPRSPRSPKSPSSSSARDGDEGEGLATIRLGDASSPQELARVLREIAARIDRPSINR